MIGLVAFLACLAALLFIAVLTLVPSKVDKQQVTLLESRNRELEAALRQIFIDPDQAQLYASIALENSTKSISKEK